MSVRGPDDSATIDIPDRSAPAVKRRWMTINGDDSRAGSTKSGTTRQVESSPTTHFRGPGRLTIPLDRRLAGRIVGVPQRHGNPQSDRSTQTTDTDNGDSWHRALLPWGCLKIAIFSESR